MLPAGRSGVVRVAIPRASSDTDLTTPLAVKVIVPPGNAVARAELTVAVNVTVCPTKDGFVLLDTTVVVAVLFTVCVVEPVLAVKAVSPL